MCVRVPILLALAATIAIAATAQQDAPEHAETTEWRPGWRLHGVPAPTQRLRSHGPALPFASHTALLAEIAALSGHEPSSFVAEPPRHGARFVSRDYRQTHGGVPVCGSRIAFRLDAGGRLVTWSARTLDVRGVDPRPVVVEASARAAAASRIAEHGGSAIQVEQAALLIRAAPDGARPARLVWRVHLRSEGGRHTVDVDAADGTIVEARDRAVACCGGHGGNGGTGQVRAVTHDGALAWQATSMTLMPDVTIVVDGTSVVSGLSGLWSLPGLIGSVTVTSDLGGPWLQVNDQIDPEPLYIGTTVGGALDVQFDDSNSTLAQRDLAMQVNRTHQWLKDHLPSFAGMDAPLVANVNDDLLGPCNAWYDPFMHEVGFGSGGGTCAPMATVGSIVAHEYGHAITGAMYTSFSSTSLTEALADITAFMTTGSPAIGEGYAGPGTQFRHMVNAKVFPVHSSAVYDLAEIYGGAFWHAREAFIAKYGNAGADLIAQQFLEHQLMQPLDAVEGLLAFLVVNDDDGDLANGTPDAGLLYEAFTLRKRIPFPVDLPPEIAHHRLHDSVLAGTDHTVEAVVALVGGGEVASVQVHWDDGAETGTVTMSEVEQGRWRGAIPHRPEGRVVEYWIEAMSATGIPRREPHRAPLVRHSFRTAQDVVLFADDFEGSSAWTTHAQWPGFTPDWELGTPAFTDHPYDPARAWSGTKVWGNGVTAPSGGYTTTLPVATWLESPVVDCSGAGDVVLEYRRWLSVTFGVAAIDVSADGGAAWTEVWTTGANSALHDRAWQLHRVRLPSAAGSAAVKVRFRILPTGPLAGGWTIDDVRLVTGRTAVVRRSGPGGALVLGEPGDRVWLMFGEPQATFVPDVGDLALDPFAPGTWWVVERVVMPAEGFVSFDGMGGNRRGVLQAVVIRPDVEERVLIGNTLVFP